MARGSRAGRVAGEHRGLFVGLAAGLTIVGLPALGFVASSHTLDAFACGALILLAGVLVIDIRFVPMLSIPCTLLVLRAGGGSGLSVSDLVLFLGTLCALTVFPLREAPEVRKLLSILAFYEATTLLTVIDNPYRADIIEWVHEAFLVGGSLIVGWVIGRSGKAKPAITTFVILSVALALWAGGETLTTHLKAANLPLGLQKNFIGDMLSFTALLLYARPAWLGWRGRIWHRVALILCLLGILAAQSKQAIISLVVGVVFMYFRNRGLARRSKAIFIALVPMAIIAYSIVSDEISSHNKFNSVYTRLSVYTANLKVWDLSPLVGVGLRWWYQARFVGSIQPPNAEMEMLTSAGIVGLIGFFVLFAGSVSVLRKVPRHLGTLALAVVVMRFVQGQLDIFWVAAQGSLPWMLAGVILGVAAIERSLVPRTETTVALQRQMLPPS
jgi:hypothetical protein